MRRRNACFVLSVLVLFPLGIRASNFRAADQVYVPIAGHVGQITSAPVCEKATSPTPFQFGCFVAAQGTSTQPGVTIWNFDPITGGSHAFPQPSAFGSSPFVNGLTIDAVGTVWFAGFQGSQSFLGNLTPTGTMTKFTNGLTAAAVAGATHIGMTPGSNGTIFFTEPGTNSLGEINETTGQITEFHLPKLAQLQDVTSDKNGSLWMSDFSGNFFEFNPTTKSFTSSAVPLVGSALSHPGFMTTGTDGTIYATDSGQNTIDVIDASGIITAHLIPTLNSNPLGIAAGQDGYAYFPEANTGKLGYLNFTQPTPGEIPGLSSSPVLFLSQSSTLPSGAVASFVGIVPGNPAGQQVARIDVVASSPCPPVTRKTVGPFICLIGTFRTIDLGPGPEPPGDLTGVPPGMDPTNSGSFGQWGLDGAPTTVGTYHVVKNEVDSNGCPVILDCLIVVIPQAGMSCDINVGTALCLLAETSPDTIVPLTAAPSPRRFWLSLYAVDPRTGDVGVGQPIPQKDEFGYFSFPSFTGDTTLPEVMVKMLDARSISCCFWLFHTGLTDLQYTLTAVDTVTGNYKQYQNDRSDPTKLCGGADTGFFDGVTKGPLSAPLLPAPQSNESLSGGSAFFGPAPTQEDPVRAASASCVAGTNTICLLGNRFAATLSAVDPRTGHVGAGTSIPQKDNFGYFSLPSFTGDPTFPEVFVKMIDARSFTCCFWVFHAGLTDLEYTLTITDTTDGSVKVYHNDRSDPSKLCGGADTSAFH